MFRTNPAFHITSKCLVIACRVTFVPFVSRVMDIGPSSQSREINISRVSSPKAAKIAADCLGCSAAFDLFRADKIFLDKLQDYVPSFFIRGERLDSPRQRDLVKPRFGDRQQHSIFHFL